MSSLFNKLKTLVKASVPGRRSPYTPSDDTWVSSADIEERLEWMEEQDRKKRETAESMQDRLQRDPDPKEELAKIVEELEAEQVTPALDSAESAPPTPEDTLSDALVQELKAESAEIHQQVDASNDEAQAIAGRAAELTEQAGNPGATAPVVDEATVAEARRTLDSAEKEIVVPADSSDAVKKSAQQAQELIDKARGAIDGKAAPAADESILQKASRTLDSAAKGIGVPADATEAVKKSAQQAGELIEKARDLIGEKSAELADATDLPLPTIPSSSDDDEPSSDLDDIKRRLG